MIQTAFRSLKMTLVLAIVLCGVYPLIVSIFGLVFFPTNSSGGMIEKDGRVIGAHLIGQNFTKPEYFHGRPSAAGEKGYDAANSSGSNLGPTNQKLVKAIEANVKTVLQENPDLVSGQVPVDLVTTSGSGLDPHISPEGAYVQAGRVAKARGITVDRVKQLIASHIEGRQFGIFGEPVVNVLELNLDLDNAMK